MDYWSCGTNNIHNKYTNDKLMEKERDRSREYKQKFHPHNRKAVMSVIDKTIGLLFGVDTIKEITEVALDASLWVDTQASDYFDKPFPIGDYEIKNNTEHFFSSKTNLSYSTYSNKPQQKYLILNVQLGVVMRSLRFSYSNHLLVSQGLEHKNIKHTLKSFVFDDYNGSRPTHELMYYFKKWIYGKIKYLDLDAGDQKAAGQEYKQLRDFILGLSDAEYFLMFARKQNLTQLEILSMKHGQ